MDPDNLIVLAYHRLSRFPLPAGTWNTPAQFAGQVNLLRRRGIKILDPKNFGQQNSPGRSQVLLTFDDGLDDLYLHRHTLSALDVKPLVFIPTDFVGRANTWEWPVPGRRACHLNSNQIRELIAAGWEFGVHGASHRDMTAMNQHQLTGEIVTARTKLSELTGQDARFFSFPFGRTNDELLSRVQDAGYAAAFTMTTAGKSPNETFLYKRRPVYCIDSADDILAKVRDPFGRTIFGRYQLWKENVAHAAGRWSAPLLSPNRETDPNA